MCLKIGVYMANVTGFPTTPSPEGAEPHSLREASKKRCLPQNSPIGTDASSSRAQSKKRRISLDKTIRTDTQPKAASMQLKHVKDLGKENIKPLLKIEFGSEGSAQITRPSPKPVQILPPPPDEASFTPEDIQMEGDATEETSPKKPEPKSTPPVLSVESPHSQELIVVEEGGAEPLLLREPEKGARLELHEVVQLNEKDDVKNKENLQKVLKSITESLKEHKNTPKL